MQLLPSLQLLWQPTNAGGIEGPQSSTDGGGHVQRAKGLAPASTESHSGSLTCMWADSPTLFVQGLQHVHSCSHCSCS